MADGDKVLNQVEERPATYNRNFQMALIAGLVFVVIAMIYASLFRPRAGGKKIEEQVRQEIRRQAPASPEREFREQLENQERRLQERRARQAPPAPPPAPPAHPAGPVAEPVLQELLTSVKSPVESWEENETVRVRQSRRAAFDFGFFAEAPPPALPAAPALPPAPYDMESFLQQERTTLAALGRRVNPAPGAADGAPEWSSLAPPLPGPAPGSAFGAVRDSGAGGSGAAFGAVRDSGAGGSGAAFGAGRDGGAGGSGAAFGAGRDSSTTPGSRPFNLVGFPESGLAAPPGEAFKLLSTGSIMQARLDQKVISDYAGPYRCRLERNVMDVTQKFVLIPAGSLCVGQVIQTGGGHRNWIINNRMVLSVRWIVRPDGAKIKFTGNLLDHAGIGAIKGSTNYHLPARLGGAAAFALLSSETSRADFSAAGRGSTFASDVGAALRDVGADTASQYAGLAPTQTLDYGQQLRLFVAEDIYILPWRGAYQRLTGRR